MKIKQILTAIYLISFILTIYSCSTFYLSTDGLKNQLSKIDSTKINNVYDFRLGMLIAVIGGKHFYNGITYVTVEDKKGNSINLEVTPHMAVRITDSSGKKRIVYFDTMFINNNMLYGNKSHFVNIPIDPVSLSNITKLELQK